MSKTDLIFKHGDVQGASLLLYIKKAMSEPNLSRTEETQLAHLVYAYKDRSAAQKIVIAHLKSVIFIAKGYQGYGLPQADLIQQGNIGLLKAVRRFNPEFKVRFLTFASQWIKAEILQFVLNNWRLVKVATTKAQKKLFFNLNKIKSNLNDFPLTLPKSTHIAQQLGVPERDVQLMEMRMLTREDSFHPEENAESKTKFEVMDPTSSIALVETKVTQDAMEALAKGLNMLDERSRSIITSRWLKEPKATLQMLALEFGISVERVRQLEQNAIRQLKRSICL